MTSCQHMSVMTEGKEFWPYLPRWQAFDAPRRELGDGDDPMEIHEISLRL